MRRHANKDTDPHLQTEVALWRPARVGDAADAEAHYARLLELRRGAASKLASWLIPLQLRNLRDRMPQDPSLKMRPLDKIFTDGTGDSRATYFRDLKDAEALVAAAGIDAVRSIFGSRLANDDRTLRRVGRLQHRGQALEVIEVYVAGKGRREARRRLDTYLAATKPGDEGKATGAAPPPPAPVPPVEASNAATATDAQAWVSATEVRTLTLPGDRAIVQLGPYRLRLPPGSDADVIIEVLDGPVDDDARAVAGDTPSGAEDEAKDVARRAENHDAPTPPGALSVLDRTFARVAAPLLQKMTKAPKEGWSAYVLGRSMRVTAAAVVIVARQLDPVLEVAGRERDPHVRVGAGYAEQLAPLEERVRREVGRARRTAKATPAPRERAPDPAIRPGGINRREEIVVALARVGTGMTAKGVATAVLAAGEQYGKRHYGATYTALKLLEVTVDVTQKGKTWSLTAKGTTEAARLNAWLAERAAPRDPATASTASTPAASGPPGPEPPADCDPPTTSASTTAPVESHEGEVAPPGALDSFATQAPSGATGRLGSEPSVVAQGGQDPQATVWAQVEAIIAGQTRDFDGDLWFFGDASEWRSSLMTELRVACDASSLLSRAGTVRLAARTLRRRLQGGMVQVPLSGPIGLRQWRRFAVRLRGVQYDRYMATLPLILAYNASTAVPTKTQGRRRPVGGAFLPEVPELLTTTLVLDGVAREHLREAVADVLADHDARLKRIRGRRAKSAALSTLSSRGTIEDACVVLGVAPPSQGDPVDATVLNSAYKGRVVACHPDLHGGNPERTEELQRLNAARAEVVAYNERMRPGGGAAGR